MSRQLLAALLAAGVALAGCGSEEGIGQTASATLVPHVQAVRASAETGNRDEALARLAALRQTVARLRASGDLTEQGAALVLDAAVDVERQLAVLSGPAPTSGSRAPGTTSAGVKDEDQRKAEEEARKRAEEAAKKAEEEAKKRAEDAKKRAEEGKKD